MRVAVVVGILVALSVPSGAARAAGGREGDWELGVFAGYAWPDAYELKGAGTLRPDNEYLAGGRFGYFFTDAWSIEGSLQRLSTDTTQVAPDRSMDVDSVRLSVLAHFVTESRTRPYVVFGVGAERTDIDGIIDKVDPSIHGGVGLRQLLTDKMGLRIELRAVRTDVGGAVDQKQNNLEASLGLSWAFGGAGPKDSDGDGVRDGKDRCPDTPRGAIVDELGCPSDGDGDGVVDGIDRCPDTPAGDTVDERGCSKDSDGDGVNDARDRCPDTPEGAKVDASGCPQDSDGDGVVDGIDRCPDTPKGAKVDASGCPQDSDGDGVVDGIDRCPDTPKGAKVDARGCPLDGDGDGVADGIDQCPDTAKGKPVDARGCEILFAEERASLVLRDVNFALNSAELTPDSERRLDSVAQSLEQAYPDIKLEIAGHTDSTGSAGYNRTLSQRRAEAVRDYLVSKGVVANRLTAKGYGEDQPIADNTSEAGRAKNRRVELKRL